MKQIFFASIFLVIFLGGNHYPIFAQGGDLMEVLPVTNKILMLHIKDGHIDTYGIQQGNASNKIYHDPTVIEDAIDIASYTLQSNEHEHYNTPQNPLRVGRKSKGWEYQSEQYQPPWIWQHWIYLELPEPMADGNTYTLSLEEITGNTDSVTFLYDVKHMRSETVRVNMVGFPENGSKVAYLSHWMGDFNSDIHQNGGLNLDDKEGNAFWLVDYSTGEIVYTGTISKRWDKTTQETSNPDFPGGNYTRADVWECDFSDFTTPGEYVVAVEEIGRSFPFEINNDVTREAFYYAMKGLYWQRQGIVLEVEPDSIRPRGHHPDDITWRFNKDWERDGGYDVSDFGTNSPVIHGVWGHYYDAGDWDGYTSHNQVPAHLLLLYDVASESFHDGDVGNRYKLHENDSEWIDEGASGQPDLLDEARWLLDFNHRARTEMKKHGATGGVPGWVGRDAIPSGNTITAWIDTRDWYLSGENVWGSFFYAGNAAYYAINLNQFHKLQGGEGNHPEYDFWMNEALEVFNWANDKGANTNAQKRAQGYAAAAIYRANGVAVFQNIFNTYWNWEPSKGDGEWAGVNIWNISASIFALIPADRPGLNTSLHTACYNQIIARANSLTNSINGNAFRVSMQSHQFMQLGAFTTPRVTVLGVAHRLTDNVEYLNALQQSVNYVLGGNQLNMSYLSGLGERSDQWIFQPNAYLVSNKNSMVYTPENYIGQTSYFGATGAEGGSGYWQGTGTWKWSEYYSRLAAHPQAATPPSDWPGAEQKFQNRYSIQGGEFTIHQQMNHMIFAMGYLMANAQTGTDRFYLEPRPEARIQLIDGQPFNASGCNLTATASENTRYVDYYYDWRFIGRSSDKENHFKLFWEPQLEVDSELLITAVAYNERGRRSIPTWEGEKKVIIASEVDCNEPDLAVTGVSIYPSSLTLLVDENALLSARLEPSYALNNGVTWNSDNEEVVIVNEHGRIRAISEGTASITVTTDEGSFIGSAIITVESDDTSTGMAPKLLLEIYPNPTSNGSFTIKSHSLSTDEVDVLVYNISGTLVKKFRESVSSGGSNIHLNVEPGLYIIHIEGGGEKIQRKLIVL